MWKATIVTEPIEEPINEREAKEQCRVETGDTEEDEFIKTLITTARMYVEQVTGRALLKQTWDMYLDEWPEGDTLQVPKPPLIWTVASSSIKYTNSSDVEATLAITEYDVDTDSDPGQIVLKYGKSWPSATLRPMNPINLRFDCGYVEPPNVPSGLKHAIRLLVADMFEMRETKVIGASVAVLDTIDMLLYPHRVWNWRV